MENGDFVIVFCATCLLLYVYYFFYIVILCCAFLTWCDVDVLLVGSGWLVPCVFCVVVALNGPYWFCCVWGLFVLALRDFDGDDFVVSWKTVIL